MNTWFSFVISTLVLCSVGLFNGYPLFYSDTNAYILSGMHVDTPTTRPITYGLFLLISSLGGTSLWPVILVQSLILVYLIWCCIKFIAGSTRPARMTMWISFLLSVFAGVSWVSSELIADVFTPATILSIALLILVRELPKYHAILLYFIFFLSNATHISHMAISVTFLTIALIFCRRIESNHTYLLRRIGICALLTAAGYVTMSSSVAKSRHIFLMAHFNEMGVLKSYLDEHCPAEDFRICRYKEDLPADFIWNRERSPIYRSDVGWTESQHEFDGITRGILTDTKYLRQVLMTSIQWTLHQVVSFRVGNGNHPFTEESEMYETLTRYFPGERTMFLGSRQNRGTLLPVPLLDMLHTIFMALSVTVIGVFLASTRLRSYLKLHLRILTVFVIAGILVNAAVCVTIVSVVDRFGCRVMWLLPGIAMMYILSYTKYREV